MTEVVVTDAELIAEIAEAMQREIANWLAGKADDADLIRPIIPILARHRALGRLQGLEEAAAEVRAWFPCDTINDPRYAAGKALLDGIRALRREALGDET